MTTFSHEVKQWNKTSNQNFSKEGKTDTGLATSEFDHVDLTSALPCDIHVVLILIVLFLFRGKLQVINVWFKKIVKFLGDRFKVQGFKTLFQKISLAFFSSKWSWSDMGCSYLPIFRWAFHITFSPFLCSFACTDTFYRKYFQF